MPAFGEMPSAANVELVAQTAVVTSLSGGGNCFNFAEVLRVQHSAGIVPGKAWISIRNLVSNDETGPITLSNSGALAPNQLKFWSRINVTVNGQCIFIGALMKRQDSIGGNSVLLEYWDDRWLLNGIPMRGALVYDSFGQAVKFLPRYQCRTNPNGYKNFTRQEGVNGQGDGYCFCELAERGKQTLCNDQNVGQDDSSGPGEAIYATPQRFIQYCQSIATYNPPTVYQGSFATLDQTKLQWPASSCKFASGTMSNMMPDVNFTGWSMLKAIAKALDVGGEYDMTVDYSNGAVGILKFFVRDAATAVGRKNINLQRAGPASNISTVFDGTAETDASETKPGVLVEGAPPKIESEFIFSGGLGRYNDTLILPWTATEQKNFLQIIATGCDLTGTPLNGAVFTSTTISSGQFAGLAQSSAANTTQALQAARISFPKVFRCIQIKDLSNGSPTLTTIMKGSGTGANSYAGFPFLLDFRTPLAEQLQSYFEVDGTQRGRLRIPIRIQISDIDSSDQKTVPKFHDVSFNCGLRLSDDGLIWLDGLTDDQNPYDAMYSNSLQLYTGVLANGVDTTLPIVKYIRVNMAVQHDTRTGRFADIFFQGQDPNSIADQVDPTLNLAAGVTPQHYIQSSDGFQEEHQVNSSPVVNGAFQCSDGGSPPKLATLTLSQSRGDADHSFALPNKMLYTDANQLNAHCARQLKDVARFKRSSNWRLIGIRIDYAVGDFIDKVLFQGAAGEYKVNAAAVEMLYDFQKQETGLRTD